jgi:hypothetical protein
MGLARRPGSIVHCNIVLAALLACGATACTGDTPEQRLRGTMAGLQQAVEARDAGDVGALLADDLIGPRGLDRDGALQMARVSFLRHRQVGVAIVGPLQVRMQPEHASVDFDAALTGGSGGILPDAARLYRVETGWRLEGGQWRLTSATWEPRL